MKPIQTRENARKLKAYPHQSKEAQSQSPPHKKLLKKIEMVQRDVVHKADISLKENLLVREPPEEVVTDFRVEIERRFARAVANQTFKFPRKKLAEDESDDDTAVSSHNDSFESLKHVTIYDLSSQNNKRKKIAQLKQAFNMAVNKDDSRTHKSHSRNHQQTLDDEEDIDSNDTADYEEEERSGVPIEIRIRDKTSATYNKLLKLLDKQLNPAALEAQLENNKRQDPLLDANQAAAKRPQQTNQEQNSRGVTNQLVAEYNQTMNTNAMNTVDDEGEDDEGQRTEQYKRKKERNVKSQGRHERVQYSFNEMQKQGRVNNVSGAQGVRKNLSQERVGGRVDSSLQLGNSVLEKTFTQLNASTIRGDGKVDLQRLTQECFKKLYNSNILKSVTPQYVRNVQLSNKDAVFRTYTQDAYPPQAPNMKAPMGSLYQKAKSKVLSSELKVSTINMNQNKYQVKTNNTSMSATKREETPKDIARKINFNNFYGSPDPNVAEKSGRTLGQSSQNAISKKDTVRAMQMSSPLKKHPNDIPVGNSYDFSSQPKIAKKPSFKLDFNKRGQGYRDVLSSSRNRKKRTPDKYSELTGVDSAVRNSYDMQQYSYILNTSTQKNTSKKQIGFIAPNTNTAKSIAFTKAFFTYK